MAKPKKTSLLSSIAAMDPATTKRPAWFETLRVVDPAGFRDVMEVARDFLSNGVSRQKLKSQAALRRCLESQGAIPRISNGSFNNFMSWVSDAEKST